MPRPPSPSPPRLLSRGASRCPQAPRLSSRWAPQRRRRGAAALIDACFCRSFNNVDGRSIVCVRVCESACVGLSVCLVVGICVCVTICVHVSASVWVSVSACLSCSLSLSLSLSLSSCLLVSRLVWSVWSGLSARSKGPQQVTGQQS
jgi:hypothetical protein